MGLEEKIIKAIQRKVAVLAEEDLVHGYNISFIVRQLQLGGVPRPLDSLLPPYEITSEDPFSTLSMYTGLTVNVRFYDVEGVPFYVVEEPPVDDNVKMLYHYLERRATEAGINTPKELISLTKKILERMNISSEIAIKTPLVRSALYYVLRDRLFGPIAVPLLDPYVEDITWFRYEYPMQVEHKLVKSIYPSVQFINTNIMTSPLLSDRERKAVLRRLTVRLAGKTGHGLSVTRPIAEGRIVSPLNPKLFYRFSGYLDIISLNSGFTIRKFPEVKYSLPELVDKGTLSPLLAGYLVLTLMNLGFTLVVGITGSGKSVHPDTRIAYYSGSRWRHAKIKTLWRDDEKRIIVSYGREQVEAQAFDYEIPVVDESGSVGRERPLALIRHEYKGPMYRVVVEDGRTVDVTAYHSLLVVRDGRLTPVRPVEARIGDLVPVVTVGREDDRITLDYARITEIEAYEYEGHVYDFEVPVFQSFPANGIMVHNTTLLQAVISSLPSTYKVFTAEDTPELSTPAENWQPTYTRYTDLPGMMNVGYNELLKLALRQTPRVVTLGEARGEEFRTLVQMAASGHGAICLPGHYHLPVRLNGRIVYVPIRELVRFLSVHRDIVVETLSVNLERMEPEWKRVTGIIETRTDDWVIIETDKRSVRMTPDHRMVVIRDGKPVLVEAREVKPGDTLIIAKPEKPSLERSKRPQPTIYGKKVFTVHAILLWLYTLRGEPYCAEKPTRMLASLPRELVEIVSDGPGRVCVRVRKELEKEFTRKMRTYARYLPLVHSRTVEKIVNRLKDYHDGFPLGDEEVCDILATTLSVHGWEASCKNGRIHVSGERLERTFTYEKIRRVRVVHEPGKAYDIEVEDNHTFITREGIVTGNCTFHANSPRQVISRIVSPPISVSPGNLRLISNIVHVAKAKTFKEGRPRTVRRVVRVYELGETEDPDEIPPAVEVFRWNPYTDKHSPPLTIEGAARLFASSRFLHELGENIYQDEPERIVSDLLVLALAIKRMSEEGVYDIREVNRYMNRLYTKFDAYTHEIWEKIKDKVEKHVKEYSQEEEASV